MKTDFKKELKTLYCRSNMSEIWVRIKSSSLNNACQKVRFNKGKYAFESGAAALGMCTLLLSISSTPRCLVSIKLERKKKEKDFKRFQAMNKERI